MTGQVTDTHSSPPAAEPLALRLSEGLGRWRQSVTMFASRKVLTGGATLRYTEGSPTGENHEPHFQGPERV